MGNIALTVAILAIILQNIDPKNQKYYNGLVHGILLVEIYYKYFM